RISQKPKNVGAEFGGFARRFAILIQIKADLVERRVGVVQRGVGEERPAGVGNGGYLPLVLGVAAAVIAQCHPLARVWLIGAAQLAHVAAAEIEVPASSLGGDNATRQIFMRAVESVAPLAAIQPELSAERPRPLRPSGRNTDLVEAQRIAARL